MTRQPMPPGWYPDNLDPTRVRLWDGRQWTTQTAPATPPAPGSGGTLSVAGKTSWRDRWRSFRLRTKVLLVVGALVVFGALMPDEGDDAASANDRQASGSTSTEDAGASATEDASDEPVEEAVDQSTDEEEAGDEEVVEEPVVEEITMPSLRSQSIARARKALRRAGLTTEVVRQASWQPTGQVLKQDIKAGAALVAGQVVTLVVAAAMPRVPGVLGRGAVQGQAALVKAGFRVDILKKTVSSGSNNIVLSQTPPATDQAEPGSVVQLVVSNVVAPPPPPPPAPVPLASNCTSGYKPCLAPAPDYDCAGGSGDGPMYAAGPIYISGSDPYDLDNDGDGVACES